LTVVLFIEIEIQAKGCVVKKLRINKVYLNSENSDEGSVFLTLRN